MHQERDRAWVHTDQGDVELDGEEAERLAAIAETVPAAAPVADPDGKTPAGLVKRVLTRDNHRCSNCQRTLHLQVHHVEWRVGASLRANSREMGARPRRTFWPRSVLDAIL